VLPRDTFYWQHENDSLLPFVEEHRLTVSSQQALLVPSV